MDTRTQEPKSTVEITTSYSFTAKVFMFFALGLFITALFAFVCPYIFQLAGFIELDPQGKIASVTNVDGFFTVLIVAGIALVIELLLMTFVVFKKRKAVVPFFILYTITMGVVLSFFCALIDWTTIGISFGVTALAFGVLALVGFLSKGNLNLWASAGISILFSSIILLIINLLLRSSWIDWLITFALLFVVMIFTMIDFNNVKKINDTGTNDTALACYCAFNIYYDFVYIFIRVAQIVAIIKNNN